MSGEHILKPDEHIIKFFRFESWFDFSSLSETGADEMIVAQEREKSVLAKLHQVMLKIKSF